jgi:hypothetical protein
MQMKPHDFWFAVNNTEVVLMPKNPLETFGATLLHYHLVSELMDTVDRIRVREGTIQSKRPEIITPTYFANECLEGFGEEARQYYEWLRQHAKDFNILRYPGYIVQKTELNEHLITGSLAEVLARVKQDVERRNDPMAAVIQGVDQPWDVCLLKLRVDVTWRSFPSNVHDIKRRHLLDDVNGVPRAVREELEGLFLQASRHPELIKALGDKLRKYDLFEEYEDRFFALVRGRSS